MRLMSLLVLVTAYQSLIDIYSSLCPYPSVVHYYCRVAALTIVLIFVAVRTTLCRTFVALRALSFNWLVSAATPIG